MTLQRWDNSFGASAQALPFASLPDPASTAGQVRLVSDLGQAPGIYLVSDGTYWNPLNGQAVIANAHNVNLTVQSLTEALITSVAFPGGFIREGSRIRTRMRYTLPAVGTAGRIAYLRAGAVGGGLSNSLLYQTFAAASVPIGQMETMNTTTFIGGNITRNSANNSSGFYKDAAGNYASSIVHANPWEIVFAGQSAAETAQTAVTATWAAGVATFTKTAHGYAVGDKIVNTLFTPTGYNGTLIVTGVPTADTWTAAIASDPGGSGTGGSTSRTSNVTLVDYLIEWLQ